MIVATHTASRGNDDASRYSGGGSVPPRRQLGVDASVGLEDALDRCMRSNAVLVERLTRLTGRRSQCPLPSGSWSSECGDLPKCSIAGNGSCVLQCENVKLGPLPVPFPLRCDLSVCSNLSLSAAHTAFLCADGSRCPE